MQLSYGRIRGVRENAYDAYYSVLLRGVLYSQISASLN